MYSRVVWALAALILSSGAPSIAVTVTQGADEAEPVDRVISITASEAVDVQSFYRRRTGNDAGTDGSLEQELLGLTAESELPVSAARAQFEYSVWMPSGRGQDGFADDRNRLLRLRLNDHHRYADYGANFFAVGEAFASNTISRERLNAAGLRGPGEGAEFWITGRLPGLALKPRFRRLEKSQGAASLVHETFGLSYDLRLGDGPRMMYVLESSESSSEQENAATTGSRQAAAAMLKMQSPAWSMFLKNSWFDEHLPAGRQETGSVWELGGNLRVFDGLTLSPLVVDQVRDVGSQDYLRATSARLTLHTTWIDPLALDLQLQRNRRSAPDARPFRATRADLKLRAPLRLWEQAPERLFMTATVGYRGMQGLDDPSPEEGMSFRLTFDFRPAR